MATSMQFCRSWCVVWRHAFAVASRLDPRAGALAASHSLSASCLSSSSSRRPPSRRSNNMLYPKEDRVGKKLLFVCKRCNYEQDADTPVVYRHELVRSAV